MNTILQKFIWSLPVTLLAGAQVYAQEQRPNLYISSRINTGFTHLACGATLHTVMC